MRIISYLQLNPFTMSPLGQCVHAAQYCHSNYGELHELDNQVATSTSFTVYKIPYIMLYSNGLEFLKFIT